MKSPALVMTAKVTTKIIGLLNVSIQQPSSSKKMLPRQLWEILFSSLSIKKQVNISTATENTNTIKAIAPDVQLLTCLRQLQIEIIRLNQQNGELIREYFSQVMLAKVKLILEVNIETVIELNLKFVM
jgi:hypothetical protein